MKLLGKRTTRLAGFLAASAVRCWMRTLDYQVAYYDPAVDPVNPPYHGQKIYIFWHENILMPLYLRGYCNMAMLLSRHRDADILFEIGSRMGFDFVRGSTYGGGTAALLIEQHALAHGIQLADALIAATAIESGHPLCTGNAKHFRPIRALSRVAFRP